MTNNTGGNSDTPIYDKVVNGDVKNVEKNVSSSVPKPKVYAATAGAGVGSALGTIIVWVINASTGVEIPDGVELAIGVVLTAGLAFVGGYFKRD